jgi:exonuclease III
MRDFCAYIIRKQKKTKKKKSQKRLPAPRRCINVQVPGYYLIQLYLISSRREGGRSPEKFRQSVAFATFVITLRNVTAAKKGGENAISTLSVA